MMELSPPADPCRAVPMQLRRDALAGAAECIVAIEEIAYAAAAASAIIPTSM
jgi:hypothetical protein